MNAYVLKNESSGLVTGIASVLASLVAGLACIGPLAGILLGISGLGWLSQYSYLTVPASIASIVLMAVALLMYSKRKASCASRRRHQLNRFLMALTVVMVVGINVFEFVIFPNFF